MNTHAARFAAALHLPRAMAHPFQRSSTTVARSLPTAMPARTDWLERLAAWSERQPPHHHLGSWTTGR